MTTCRGCGGASPFTLVRVCPGCLADTASKFEECLEGAPHSEGD